MPSNRIFRKSRRPQNALIPFGPWQQGVNEKTQPHLLEFSELSDAKNVMLDEDAGKLTKRPGTVHRTDLPFLIDPPVSSYSFIKRDGTEFLLVTDSKKLIVSGDLVTWSDITPELFLFTNQFAGGGFALNFETAEDKVWVSNGADPVFSWDGVLAVTTTESLVGYDKGTTQIEWTTADVLDTQASLSDALLDRSGDGTTWKGQVIVCTDAVNTDNIGITREILTFNDGTDTVTFVPFPAGISDTDKFLVGVQIPNGRYLAYHHSTMFIASTPANGQEIRFSAITDPNEPAIIMAISNPNAWDAFNQLNIGSGQGDRIYGFSHPVYRDRIAVYKRRGIYRIDPDPTFQFVPVTLTEQFGSRFPGSWQQHGDILMFLGEDEDGLPDIYMTDFTTVKHFDRKHKKTLDNLKQPTTTLRSETVASVAEWGAGAGSETADTATGTLKSKLFSRVDLHPKLVDESGFDTLTNAPSQKATILGQPIWDNRNDGSPTENGWTLELIGHPYTVVASEGVTQATGRDQQWFVVGTNQLNHVRYFKNFDTDVNTKDVFVKARLQHLLQAGDNEPPQFARSTLSVSNGNYWIAIELYLTGGLRVNGVFVTNPVSHINQFQNYAVLLRADGTQRLWINGSEVLGLPGVLNPGGVKRISSGHAFADFNTGIFGSPNNLGRSRSYAEYINFHEDFKGADLLGATLPSEGEASFVMDYKAAPDSFGKQFLEFTPPVGDAHTVPNATPVPTVFSLETASSPDDITYTPFVALTVGDTPGIDNATPEDRYLKVKYKITNNASQELDGDYLEQYLGGHQYITEALQVGAGIKAWDIFQIDKAGLPLTSDIKIRVATTASLGGSPFPDPTLSTGWDTTRAGSDANGWMPIIDVQNIGGALGGLEDVPNPPDPEGRFVQIKITATPHTLDEVFGVNNLVINWLEGSAQFLPVSSSMFQKKYLLSGSTLTSDTNNIILTLDANRAFSNWEDVSINFFTWFGGKLYIGGGLRKELVEMNPAIFHDDDGPSGGGRAFKAIEAYVETKQEIAGAIHSRKKSRYLECAADVESSSILFSFKRDIEAIWTVLNTVVFSASVSHKRLNFPMGKQFKRITLRAENNTIDEDFGLEGFVLQVEQVPSRSGL